MNKQFIPITLIVLSLALIIVNIIYISDYIQEYYEYIDDWSDSFAYYEGMVYMQSILRCTFKALSIALLLIPLIIWVYILIHNNAFSKKSVSTTLVVFIAVCCVQIIAATADIIIYYNFELWSLAKSGESTLQNTFSAYDIIIIRRAIRIAVYIIFVVTLSLLLNKCNKIDFSDIAAKIASENDMRKIKKLETKLNKLKNQKWSRANRSLLWWKKLSL